jgi:hypothetical protein
MSLTKILWMASMLWTDILGRTDRGELTVAWFSATLGLLELIAVYDFYNWASKMHACVYYIGE